MLKLIDRNGTEIKDNDLIQEFLSNDLGNNKKLYDLCIKNNLDVKIYTDSARIKCINGIEVNYNGVKITGELFSIENNEISIWNF